MSVLVETAARVQSLCRRKNFPFAFIGGLALLRWGQSRVTDDIDLTIFTGYDLDNEVIDAFISEFRPRIEQAADFARENRVLLLSDPLGSPIDLSLGALPYEQRVIARGSFFDFGPPEPVFTCSAEDLVILKAFADRDKDWIDIRGVVGKQSLDRDLIREELSFLLELKEDLNPMGKLESIFQASR